MHSNAEILTAVLTYWLQPMSEAVASRVLGNKLDRINEWAKKLFPLPANYSITQELNFLISPTMSAMLAPAVKNMLASSGWKTLSTLTTEDKMPGVVYLLALDYLKDPDEPHFIQRYWK